MSRFIPSFIQSTFIVTNISTKTVDVLGMRLKPDQSIDLFNAIPGITESKILEEMRAPNGNLYIESEIKGTILIEQSEMGTLQHNPDPTFRSVTYSSSDGSTDWDAMKKMQQDNVTIYVDPDGDDNATGTENDPIQTIYEATKRLPLMGAGNVIQLTAGTHYMTDHVGTSVTKTQFANYGSQIYLQGVTPSTVETFVIDGVSNNVFTAQDSPGWTVDEHKGRIVTGTFGFGYKWMVMSNTASTIDVAILGDDLGGWYTLPSNGEVITIEQFDTKVVPPTTNSSSGFNRLFLDGDFYVRYIFFDGEGSAGSGPGSTKRSTIFWDTCRFENYGQCLTVDGADQMYTCRFYNAEEAIEVHGTLFNGGSVVFEDLTGAIDCWVGEYSVGEGLCTWNIGCWVLYGGRIAPSAINDHSKYVYIEAGRYTPTLYLQCESYFKYRKWKAPLNFHPKGLQVFATGVLNIATNTSPAEFVFYDSTSSNIDGTSYFANLDGSTISKQDYLDGYAPASSPLNLFDDKGNRLRN